MLTIVVKTVPSFLLNHIYLDYQRPCRDLILPAKKQQQKKNFFKKGKNSEFRPILVKIIQERLEGNLLVVSVQCSEILKEIH